MCLLIFQQILADLSKNLKGHLFSCFKRRTSTIGRTELLDSVCGGGGVLNLLVYDQVASVVKLSRYIKWFSTGA